MKTLYLEISKPRIIITKILGKFWRSAYFAPTSPLHLVQMPDPVLPDPHWARVRNRMCGICGSDLHQIFVDASLDVAPVALPSHKRIYLGHEMVGDVIEVGENVSQIQPGDRVVRWGRADDCLARGRKQLCPPCQKGHRVLCQYASQPRDHAPIGGGFGDSFITPASTLVRVPGDLPDEKAIFAEPLAVAIHAAYRRLPQKGDKVLLLGVGTIGYLLLQTLRLLQPNCHLTALVQYPWQAELASQLGANETILSGQDPYQMVKALTGGSLYENSSHNRMIIGGFDMIFDNVGVPQTLNNALRWTKAGGTVVLVGVNLHRMKVDLTPVWHQEVNLIGAVGHDIVPWNGKDWSTFDLAMSWMAKGKINTLSLLTHRYSLHEFRQAFDTALDKKVRRSIKVAFDLN